MPRQLPAIVLLNGPFGVGKTTLAHVLRNRLPRSRVYNPELTGTLLRATIGRVVRRDDYQDLPLWCPLVVATARVLRPRKRGYLLIPMTLANRTYFDAIVRGLRATRHDVVCFRLTATAEELRTRIRGRPEAKGGHTWGLAHLPSGIETFSDPHFGAELATDGKSPEELADAVISHLRNRR